MGQWGAEPDEPGPQDNVPRTRGFSRDILTRMSRFYRFYAEQRGIVAQVVRQLQPAENKEDAISSEAMAQIWFN